VIMSLDKW